MSTQRKVPSPSNIRREPVREVAVLEAASLPVRSASAGQAGKLAANPSYEATPDGGNRQRCTCADFDGFVDCPVHI